MVLFLRKVCSLAACALRWGLRAGVLGLFLAEIGAAPLGHSQIPAEGYSVVNIIRRAVDTRLLQGVDPRAHFITSISVSPRESASVLPANALRQPIQNAAPPPVSIAVAIGQDHAGQGLLLFSQGAIRLVTSQGELTLAPENNTDTDFLFSLTPKGKEAIFPIQLTGYHKRLSEPLDHRGMPLRWQRLSEYARGGAYRECRLHMSQVSPVLRLLQETALWGQGASLAGANRYKAVVEQYAEKYKLTPGMVLAIMRVESNFNPFAVSPRNALGLMQIVQSSAGSEAHTYLTGSPGEPEMETLLNPEHNIKYGTTYLHLLARRHFGGIINTASRDLCVIAAYNGGPGAVLRVFDQDRDAAIAIINALTTDEVHKKLTEELPTAESRRYIGVVLEHLQTYSSQ